MADADKTSTGPPSGLVLGTSSTHPGFPPGIPSDSNTIEVPLPTIVSLTSPVLITSMASGITKDGHAEHSGHPVPVFWLPHCLVSATRNSAELHLLIISH